MSDHAASSPIRSRVGPSNREGLDYREQAGRLGPPAIPIVDVHLHVNGLRAAKIYREVADLYGIDRIYTQTRLSDADKVREVLGPRARFLAVADWSSPDRGQAYRAGFLDHMRIWHERHGARMVKFWSAPRLWDVVGGDPRDVVPLDSPWRVRAAELATELGMMIMVHVADPDTWFATKYADGARYGGPKAEHYPPLERMMDRFPGPWLLAHMGGWPENLDFLDGLLTRHANCHLDTSATKWMVRELGRHEPERVRGFMSRWRGRILFGSDIVTLDDHLASGNASGSVAADLADSPESAFDLYASRYYALRLMWETDRDGPSPIADPDLKMVDPAGHDGMSAPRLRGVKLERGLLEEFYAGATDRLVTRWYDMH